MTAFKRCQFVVKRNLKSFYSLFSPASWSFCCFSDYFGDAEVEGNVQSI